MMVTLNLTAEEYRQLRDLAQYRALLEPGELLERFVGDLTHSLRTGGSDERMHANDWLDRRYGPQWYIERTYPDRPKPGATWFEGEGDEDEDDDEQEGYLTDG